MSSKPHDQHLLGHQSIATTLRYYAASRDETALARWRKLIDEEKDK